MTAITTATLSHGMIVPVGGADPDTVIEEAGGNYMTPAPGDVRNQLNYGAGDYAAVGTLLPPAGPADLGALTGANLALKKMHDTLYDGDFGVDASVVRADGEEISVRALKPKTFMDEMISAGGAVIPRGEIEIKVRVNDDLAAGISTDDRIQYGGELFRVLSADTYQIAGQVYEWKVMARR